MCARAPFCSLDETQEPPNGLCESTGKIFGSAFAIFLVIQWGFICYFCPSLTLHMRAMGFLV